MVSESENFYASMLDAKNRFFAYVFTDGDLARIQKLINELRKLITQSKDFEDNHKERLLKRLENLQSELHKRMSNLDKLWALLPEAGVALGKFGENAKPFADRICEIAGIAWRAQLRAEELPSAVSSNRVSCL